MSVIKPYVFHIKKNGVVGKRRYLRKGGPSLLSGLIISYDTKLIR